MFPYTMPITLLCFSTYIWKYLCVCRCVYVYKDGCLSQGNCCIS